MAPLVNTLYRCAHRTNAPFHTPGHKRGQGLSAQHRRLFGIRPFQADLPELPDLDNLFAPEGVILEAQALAADAFGADKTYFLANGSTCGIEAAILTTCGPNDKLILPRNVHSSAIAGLILSGATPIYITPPYNPEWDITLGASTEALEQALIEHPDAKAVLIVSPTYHGICADLAAIVQLTHAYNIPLIVDEAHAPHFAFHPALPVSALEIGADIAVQSAHKVLSAFTQAALLHVQGDLINVSRLNQSLQLTQSTSPSYLLLGSLDAARHQMATQGEILMAQTLELANRACEEIEKIEGLRVLQPGRRDTARGEQGLGGDCTRLTVDVSGLGLTGFEADDLLHSQFGVTAELPALQHLMFIVSLGNTPNDITQLIQGLKQLCQRHPPIEQHSLKSAQDIACLHQSLDLFSSGSVPQRQKESITPRQAFFASSLPLPTPQTIGRICAETICPYPPGIPTLLPGDPISAEAIAHLQKILSAGGSLAGCRDPQLKTILIVQ